MRAIEFVPRTAAVKVGHRVCWVNDDDVQHDAVAEDGAFESPLYGQGQTYTTTVRRTGSIAYVCTVHPGMKGTLRVSP
jgi:plastocyanin